MTKTTHIIIKDRVTIPLSEIRFQFSTSSGPGGQHANRSATRATLLFDITNSPSLDENSRARLLDRLALRLDKEGVLHIQAQDFRSQKRNRKIALSRLTDLLNEALTEPKKRITTVPSAAKIEKQKMEKKKHSRRKQQRQKDWSKEE